MRLGSDRRQPILKEAQVSRLYGDAHLREIARQSESIRVPVPLAFGCGTVKGGEWLPARRELSDYLPSASRFARLLALPFCGFTSLSDLISEATVGGKRQSFYFNKPTMTTAAGAAYWLWLQGGYPQAGALPAAGTLACTFPTNATAGAMAQTNAAGGDTLHMVSVAGQSTVAAGALLLYDLVDIVQPALATTTAQTITGTRTTRYLTTAAAGVGLIVFTGAANQTTTVTILITYTDEAGNTGNTTATITANATSPANRTLEPTGKFFYDLAGGDAGVRRIETTRWATAPTVATAIGCAYPYCFMPLGVANTLFGTDLINTQFNLVQVQDSACLTFAVLAGTTSSGQIQGELVLVSG